MSQNLKNELLEDIQKAKILLKETKDYYSKGNKEALADMIQQGERAASGKEELPFKRNREFYRPAEEEAVRFALNRYTMAPTYLEKGVYDFYGLKKAIEWYHSIDLRGKAVKDLCKKTEDTIRQSEEFMKNSRFGSGIGEVDRRIAENLEAEIQKAKQQLKIPEKESLVKAIVRLTDLRRELLFSGVLRSDVDSESTLFLTGEELEGIKSALKEDKELQQKFQEINKKAEEYTLEELQYIYEMVYAEDDYESMNERYFLWSYTDKIANFDAPVNAKYATLRFILPCEENEAEGLGHVWIDDIELMSGSGKELKIENAGFEEGDKKPFFWTPYAMEGAPVMEWEEKYPFCGKDKKSIYLCNPTKQDQGAWNYEEKIPVTGGEGYTLTFYAKLDGKLKKGLLAEIEFEDENGEKAGKFEYIFNRKSYYKTNMLNLNMQCDAIIYAFTGQLTYAEKAKYGILCFLQDFCQGAEHWMTVNLRPDGSDAYGAVQGGRNLAVIASTYSLIKKAKIWKEKELARFYRLTDYMLRYMLDLRDRTELPAEEAQRGCSNWQTDMCMGTALMMMALEDFPNRKNWLYNAHAVLKAQLMYNVNPDGSWPESIRYHHAALEHFASYARGVQKNMGENWFQDTLLKDMFVFSLNLQTPAYPYFDWKISTPPFGDHALSCGKEFSVYGPYLRSIEKINKQAADKMFATWCLAGKPGKPLWGESIILENLMIEAKDYRTEPGFQLELQSTAEFRNAGITVFRKHFGQKKQSYFAIMSSPRRIKHGHYDQGAFIIYKNSIPIVMDSGIEGYFDSSTEWHLCSYSHACLLFAYEGKPPEKDRKSINLSAGTYSNERGWYDVPESSRVLEVETGSEIEHIKIRIDHPKGRGCHIREVYWIKAADLYVIRDYIINNQGKVLFNLPVASIGSEISGNRILSEGYYEIDLETIFLSPVNQIMVEAGRTAPFLPVKEKIQLLQYIRAQAEAENGFLTLLYPKDKTEERLKIKEDNGSYHITCQKGLEVLIKDALNQKGMSIQTIFKEV